MNVQWSLIQELMLYKFDRSNQKRLLDERVKRSIHMVQEISIVL